MLKELRFTLVLFTLCGLLYPLTSTLISQTIFPYQSNGSIISNHKNEKIGSLLIGQSFTQDKYFHPRPSQNNYDASNSGGSNLGPTSEKLMTTVKANIKAYKVNNKSIGKVPLDAVTTSASGLDPNISFKNSWLQVNRIAKARNVSEAKIKDILNNHIYQSPLSQNKYINVLEINLALDKACKL